MNFQTAPGIPGYRRRRAAIFQRCLVAAAIFTMTFHLPGASPEATQRLLRNHHHAWLPYPLPFETSLEEVARVADSPADVIGLLFAAPYHQGAIDFSRLDEAVELVRSRHKKLILHVAPRFGPSEGIRDQLSNGQWMEHRNDRSPHYAILDVFDPVQREKFNDYLRICAAHFAGKADILGWAVGWGYMGETGFFIGDFLSDSRLMGTVSAGYSNHALRDFNRWRLAHAFPVVEKLPLPSTGRQSRDYVLFHRFRSEFLGDVFQGGALRLLQKKTGVPAGTFGYVAAHAGSYARDWTFTPSADFFRTAGAAASFDLHRTLIDSGIGWEDSGQHDGGWRFAFQSLKRDILRQQARGGVHHAMLIREYDADRKWETNLFSKVSTFLAGRPPAPDKPPQPEIALYVPTWGVAALPSRDADHLFLPRPEDLAHLEKFVGLVESFGLPYQIITEKELLRPRSLENFRHLLIPMADFLPLVLGESNAKKLLDDRRVMAFTLEKTPVSRSRFRQELQRRKISPRLDFDSDRLLAGRIGGLLYNWSDTALFVRVPDNPEPVELGPDAADPVASQTSRKSSAH